jgi:hypothetical protein
MTVRYREHARYIKTNNPISVCDLHILNSRHEYGLRERTWHMLKPCRNGNFMNLWEKLQYTSTKVASPAPTHWRTASARTEHFVNLRSSSTTVSHIPRRQTLIHIHLLHRYISSLDKTSFYLLLPFISLIWFSLYPYPANCRIHNLYMLRSYFSINFYYTSLLLYEIFYLLFLIPTHWGGILPKVFVYLFLFFLLQIL